MIKNLFRPHHLLDPWRDDFVIALRLRDVPGRRIGDALALVDAHCTDSGEEPQEAFGDPVAYATQVADQVRPVDLVSGMSPLRAGLPGLAVLLAVPALLSGVAGLAHSSVAEVSVGSLVGAVTGAAAISLLIRFALLLGPRRRGTRFVAIFCFMGAMIFPSMIWTATAVDLSAWLSVGIAVVLLAATFVSLRRTGPDLVVDPLTGRDSIPTPRWLAPGTQWLLPLTLAGAILIVALVPPH